MIPISGTYFTFKGKTSVEMGVELISMPARSHPAPRGEQKKVSGRDGYLWMSDGSTDAYPIRADIVTKDNANIDAVLAWLDGAGELIFSDEPDRAYDARIVTAYIRNNFAKRVANQKATISWQVQPYARKVSSEPVTITQSGDAIPCTNATAYGKPRVVVYGSGSFDVTIGRQTIRFNGVTNGIIVDSELGDAITLGDGLLANDKIDGELWTLDPKYVNTVSWITGGQDENGNVVSGNVTSIKIYPRWRFI